MLYKIDITIEKIYEINKEGRYHIFRFLYFEEIVLVMFLYLYFSKKLNKVRCLASKDFFNILIIGIMHFYIRKKMPIITFDIYIKNTIIFLIFEGLYFQKKTMEVLVFFETPLF